MNSLMIRVLALAMIASNVSAAATTQDFSNLSQEQLELVSAGFTTNSQGAIVPLVAGAKAEAYSATVRAVNEIDLRRQVEEQNAADAAVDSVLLTVDAFPEDEVVAAPTAESQYAPISNTCGSMVLVGGPTFRFDNEVEEENFPAGFAAKSSLCIKITDGQLPVSWSFYGNGKAAAGNYVYYPHITLGKSPFGQYAPAQRPEVLPTTTANLSGFNLSFSTSQSLPDSAVAQLILKGWITENVNPTEINVKHKMTVIFAQYGDSGKPYLADGVEPMATFGAGGQTFNVFMLPPTAPKQWNELVLVTERNVESLDKLNFDMFLGKMNEAFALKGKNMYLSSMEFGLEVEGGADVAGSFTIHSASVDLSLVKSNEELFNPATVVPVNEDDGAPEVKNTTGPIFPAKNTTTSTVTPDEKNSAAFESDVAVPVTAVSVIAAIMLTVGAQF